MKTLFYTSLALIVLSIPACTKSSGDPSSPLGSWQLVKENWSVGSSWGVRMPAKDSSVLLVLGANNKYVTELNHTIVAKGDYAITSAANYFHEPELELATFTPTGIFSLFELLEIGSNGQVLSESHGMYMKVSNDSLTLSSPLTPGGSTSYFFVKQ